MFDAVAMGSCYNSDIRGKGDRGQISFFPAAVNRACNACLRCHLTRGRVI